MVSQFVPTACDSLIIDHVQWSAFSDTAVQVHVFNNSTTLFDYPGFVLLQGTDSLARETVNYFGIAGESYHTLALVDGATVPTSPFQGQLHSVDQLLPATGLQLRHHGEPLSACTMRADGGISEQHGERADQRYVELAVDRR